MDPGLACLVTVCSKTPGEGEQRSRGWGCRACSPRLASVASVAGMFQGLGCGCHVSHPEHLSASCAQILPEAEVCERPVLTIYTAKSLPGLELNSGNSGLGTY